MIPERKAANPWNEHPEGTKAIGADGKIWIKAENGWQYGNPNNPDGMTSHTPGDNVVTVIQPWLPTTFGGCLLLGAYLGAIIAISKWILFP